MVANIDSRVRRLLQAATLGSLDCMRRLGEIPIPRHFLPDMLQLSFFHLSKPPPNPDSQDQTETEYATEMAWSSLVLIGNAIFLDESWTYSQDVWCQVGHLWPWIRRLMSANDRNRSIKSCCNSSVCVLRRDYFYETVARIIRSMMVFHENKGDWYCDLPEFMKVFTSLWLAELRLGAVWHINETGRFLDQDQLFDAFCDLVGDSSEPHSIVKTVLRGARRLANEPLQSEFAMLKLNNILALFGREEQVSSLFHYSQISKRGTKTILDILHLIIPTSWQSFERTFQHQDQVRLSLYCVSGCIIDGLSYIMKTAIIPEPINPRKAALPALRRNFIPVLLQAYDFAVSVREDKPSPEDELVWSSIISQVEEILQYLTAFLYTWRTLDCLNKLLLEIDIPLSQYRGAYSSLTHFLGLVENLVKLRDRIESERKCHNIMCISKSPLRRCSRCDNVEYCSRECQRGDWPSHRGQCIAPSDELYYKDRLLLHAVFHELVPLMCMQDLKSGMDALIQQHGPGTKSVVQLDINVLPWKVSVYDVDSFLSDETVNADARGWVAVCTEENKQVLYWRIVKMGAVTWHDVIAVDYVL